ncbi:hypothetical protein RFI_22557 [Reticulomyxa filosa]|uniref:Uncharacterized protein n=1 Tax=Reticulomyxa filosa TaxID=46433 RepID=X6MP05_RETFI|nr:hypothetical protein RFI_22557 [Reticulomyxa filosa]|eukprot:ETO14810.1 hypothetical protein RFI_22557 [Reticulomyxa filosa]
MEFINGWQPINQQSTNQSAFQILLQIVHEKLQNVAIVPDNVAEGHPEDVLLLLYALKGLFFFVGFNNLHGLELLFCEYQLQIDFHTNQLLTCDDDDYFHQKSNFVRCFDNTGHKKTNKKIFPNFRFTHKPDNKTRNNSEILQEQYKEKWISEQLKNKELQHILEQLKATVTIKIDLC